MKCNPEIFWLCVRGEALPENVDWNPIIDRARSEGILHYLAFLHRNIPNGSDLRRTAAAHHLSRIHLIKKIIDIFNNAGFDWAVLKGFSIAVQLYTNPESRVSGDCDIIVRKENFDKAAAILLKNGFHQTSHHRELFVGQEGQIDLHTSFVNAERIKSREKIMTEMNDWNFGIRKINTEAGIIPVLNERDTAKYLALHFIHHHGCFGARWLIDIHKLLLMKKELLYDIALLGRNGEFLLYLLLQLLKSDLDFELKPTRIEKILFQSVNDGIEIPGARFLLSLCDIDNTSVKINFIRETLFPRKEVLFSAAYSQNNVSPLRFHIERILKSILRTCKLYIRTIGGLK